KYVTMFDQGHVVVLGTEMQERLDFALQGQHLYSIDWAPDERHLALHYLDNAKQSKQTIYGVDGTEISDTKVDVYGWWSKDGRLYFYLSDTGKIRDLMIRHVDNGQVEMLASDVDQLYGVLDNGQILVLWRNSNEYMLATLDPETKIRHVISDNV